MPTKMKGQLPRCKGGPYSVVTDLSSLWVSTTHWTSDQAFNGLVACVDMFFSKFPDLIHSNLCICTLQSRFKDCAALSYPLLMSQYLAIPIKDMAYWMFTAPLPWEILSVIANGEEAGQLDSYSPYIKDLNLSTRFPYSASRCVNLHHLTHMIGSLAESPRSLNAKVIAGCNMATLANLAVAISWSRMESTDYSIKIASTKDAALVGQQKRVENLQTHAECPQGGQEDSAAKPDYPLQDFTPGVILERLYSSGGLSDRAKLWAAKRMEPIVDIWVGSVGEHLKNYTAAWVS